MGWRRVVMGIEKVQSGAAPRAIGPYSQAIASGGWLFVSGQIGLDPDSGALVAGGFAAEVRRAIQNLAAIVTAGGAGLEQVVRVTVYLTDLERFAEMNAIYEEYFGASRPARSTVGVSSLPRGAVFEIDAIVRRD
jgi:2-iminobutanoate/2-iminopropanoate deaminase